MGEETELFIEKVRNYPYLYDTSHKYYKNIVKKSETWTVISAELDMTSKYGFFKYCITGCNTIILIIIIMQLNNYYFM